MKSTGTATATERHDPQDLEICISCLNTNVPGRDFCRHCGTPLTSYAATGPFESIFAEGDMWRKATRRGRYSRLVRFLVAAFIVCWLLGIILGIVFPR